MNNNTHPEPEQLAGFSENPAAPEHAGLRRHLATCADCRQRLDQLDALSRTLLAAPPGNEAVTLSDDLLQAIETGQLDDARQRTLNDNPAALKAALHYATHAPAMRGHLDSTIPFTNAPPAEPRSGTIRADARPQSSGLLQRLLDWRPPVWGSVPISAAAAFALALAVLPPAISPSNTSSPDPLTLVIASYVNRSVLTLQDPAADLPGMGFFHAADAREIPFDGLRLSYSRTDGLSANWPPVENAQNYHLRLSRVNADNQQIIAEIDVDQPQARFPQLQPEPGRYQWLLTGQKTAGDRFRASGGFVVNNL